MDIQPTKRGTWAIAIAYCLLVLAGESLHMLPGCGHNHPQCCADSSELVSSHGDHSRCKHTQTKSQSIANESAAFVVHAIGVHGDCQVCKLMASLSNALRSIDNVTIENSVSSKALLPSPVWIATNSDSVFYIRGPPAV